MNITKSASKGGENFDAVKYFVEKVAGLYVAVDSKDDRGQTSVVRHDKDTKMYPVWDSTWSETHETPQLPEYMARMTTEGPHNILTVPAKLKQTLTVYHTPPEGQNTTIYIHPSDNIDGLVPQYMRSLGGSGVSKLNLADLIPPYVPASGLSLSFGKERTKGFVTAEADSDEEEIEIQNAGRALVDLSAAVNISHVSAGSTDRTYHALSSNTPLAIRNDANQALVPFPYAYEHHSCPVMLKFDSQSTLRVIRSKADADDLVLYIKKKDGDAPFHVEYYRFK
jgi:hypothetical protein